MSAEAKPEAKPSVPPPSARPVPAAPSADPATAPEPATAPAADPPTARRRHRADPELNRRLLVPLIAGVVILVGLAVALLSGDHGASPEQTLRGASFATRFPAGWSSTTDRLPSGITTYALGSTAAKLDQLNLPAPGEVGITVAEYPITALARLGQPEAANQTPLELLPDVIGIPRAAQNPSTVTALHATALGGAPAAAIEYAYTFAGVPNVQSDVVARHGDTIVSIEMDTEPSLAAQGRSAMATAISQWRWQQTAGSAPQTGAGSSPAAPNANV